MQELSDQIRAHLCETHGKPFNFICTETVCSHKQRRICERCIRLMNCNSLNNVEEVFDFIQYSLSQETQATQQLQCSLRQNFRKNYEIITELLELLEIQIEGYISSILIQENEVCTALQSYVGRDINIEDIETLGVLLSQKLEINAHKEYQYKKKVRIEDQLGYMQSQGIINIQEQLIELLKGKPQVHKEIPQLNNSDQQPNVQASQSDIHNSKQLFQPIQNNFLMQKSYIPKLIQYPEVTIDQPQEILQESFQISQQNFIVKQSHSEILESNPIQQHYQISQFWKLKKPCYWICFNHNQSQIAIAYENNVNLFYQSQKNGMWRKSQTQLVGHKGVINQVKFNSDSTKILSCSDDKTIIIWNLNENGEWNLVQRVKSHSESVSTFDFDRNYSILVSGSPDMTIKIHRLIKNKWKVQQILTENIREVYNVCLNRNSTLLVSQSSAQTPLILWRQNQNNNNWLMSQTLSGSSGWVYRFEFNASSTELISQSNGCVNIWTVNNQNIWECKYTLLAENPTICRPKFNRGIEEVGQVITIIWENVVQIWKFNELCYWECIQTISEHSHLVNCVIINHDYSMMITLSDDGMLIIHKLQPS